jgi:hypothetical protein
MGPSDMLVEWVVTGNLPMRITGLREVLHGLADSDKPLPGNVAQAFKAGNLWIGTCQDGIDAGGVLPRTEGQAVRAIYATVPALEHEFAGAAPSSFTFDEVVSAGKPAS